MEHTPKKREKKCKKERKRKRKLNRPTKKPVNIAVQHIHRVASRIACNGIIIITSTQQIMHTPNHSLIQIERIKAEHNNLSAMVIPTFAHISECFGMLRTS